MKGEIVLNNLITNLKKTKELSENVINIPFHYIVFFFALFLMWQPQYVKLIDATSWVPENIKNIMLNVVNLVYFNIIPIFGTLVIILVVLSLLANSTNIFDKILPKDVDFNNNTTISWNQFSAINRVIGFSVNLATVFWIYYFLINILFNRYNYVENFLINDSNLFENELITTGYMTSSNLEIMNLLFWLNIMVSVFLVVRSLFEIKIPTRKYYIDNISFYIQINSFHQKNGNGNKFQILIVKDKYQNKPYFYLVSVVVVMQKREFIDSDIRTTNVTVPLHQRVYKVLNYSRNLDEIIYHFDSLKNDE